MESILTSIKKLLGIPEEILDFDLDVIMHINSAFSDLHQLGVGPVNGFEIDGPEQTWDSFLFSNMTANNVKQYVYLKTRVVFDPPATSFALDSMNKKILELEWRINVAREGAVYPMTNPPVTGVVIDGGAP